MSKQDRKPRRSFGKKDCIHVEEEKGECSINKGCGSGFGYCRPIWTDEKCYSLEKPNDHQLEHFGYRVYAHGNTLVCRDMKTGDCWQLRPGDHMGKIAEEDLIFVKKAVLSD